MDGKISGEKENPSEESSERNDQHRDRDALFEAVYWDIL